MNLEVGLYHLALVMELAEGKQHTLIQLKTLLQSQHLIMEAVWLFQPNPD